MKIRSKRSIGAAAGLAAVLLLAACGGDDEGAAADTTAAAVEATAAPETTAAAPETTAAAPETTAAVAADTTVAAESAGPATIDVELVEWAINAPTSIPAGTVTFNVTNSGEFPHELVVFQGDSYESLPLLPSGAVDESAVGAGLIGETERFDGGTSSTLTVDLPAGNYVLVCNIEFGGGSHPARGQVLSITAT